MELDKPLAWLRGVGPGAYLVEAPVWLVTEEPEQHQFVLALDEIMRDGWRPEAFPAPADLLRRREYAERTVRQRLHQPIFRRQVLQAYRTQCALCRLRHGELLDAAHIKEDSDGGEPQGGRIPIGGCQIARHGAWGVGRREPVRRASSHRIRDRRHRGPPPAART